MGKRLYWLDDRGWAAIEPLLPRGRRGAHRVDDRRVISGIMHMLETGARWRDCPVDYGPYMTIYNRFHRWRRQGVWQGIFSALTGLRSLDDDAGCGVAAPTGLPPEAQISAA